MLNRKFGRHIGRRQQYTPLPMVQLHQRMDFLARAPLAGVCPVGQRINGFTGGAIIDPPVGGFAQDDLLWAAPFYSILPTVIAAIPGLPQCACPPGHFRVHIWGGGPCQTQKSLYFSLWRWNEDLSLSKSGGPTQNRTPLIQQSTTHGQFAEVAFDLYEAEPWSIAFYARTAMVDADVLGLSCLISPVQLIDDAASSW
jgi:hypothetical protein